MSIELVGLAVLMGLVTYPSRACRSWPRASSACRAWRSNTSDWWGQPCWLRWRLSLSW